MKRLLALLLAALLAFGLAACGQKQKEPSDVLVYGSGDYTAV